MKDFDEEKVGMEHRSLLPNGIGYSTRHDKHAGSFSLQHLYAWAWGRYSVRYQSFKLRRMPYAPHVAHLGFFKRDRGTSRLLKEDYELNDCEAAILTKALFDLNGYDFK